VLVVVLARRPSSPTRQDLEDFMTTVKHKARPMAVGGVLISGTLLAGLASSYVQAINNGAHDGR
jgi:hypothetical protein